MRPVSHLAVAIASSLLAVGRPAAASVCVGNCGTDTADGVVTLSPSGNSSYQYVSTNGGVAGEPVKFQASVARTDRNLVRRRFWRQRIRPLQFYFNYITSDGAQYADYGFCATADGLWHPCRHVVYGTHNRIRQYQPGVWPTN